MPNRIPCFITSSLLHLVLATNLPFACHAISNGDFEAEPFLTGWISAGDIKPFAGFAPGSVRAVRLATPGVTRLGQNITLSADWQLDFYFAITDTTNRAFSLYVNAGGDAADASAAAANLRYQSGQFQAYTNGSWGGDLGLGNLFPSLDANGDGDFNDPGDEKNIYHFCFTARDWGTPTARYDLARSEANATNLTRFATNLTRWHNTSGGVSTSSLADKNLSTVSISGIRPHLALFSNYGEIGMGALVPWADRLWIVTYPPHNANGSSDKLWTVDSNFTLTARSESVGGTHANRLIHRESQQLIIGPYFISTNGIVRVISPAAMPGRLTASARHLTDPKNRVYFFTLENGLYDVDVNTLAVNPIYSDGNKPDPAHPVGPHPGRHGKGGYTGQGRIFYSNNGGTGVLTEHTGTNWAEPWNVVELKNFTEITSPGGICGATTEKDPIWSLGWDTRSVILKLLDGCMWSTFRLPKASYTHDSATGWYTEWPRIREIVDGRMLMHMHGMFYDFPKTFSAANTAGIQPLCTHLKMPVDYCWWNGQIAMGCDVSSSINNKWAGQSHSAPWFGQFSDFKKWGAPAGFGGPLNNDDLAANTPSDPFLVTGFKQRVLHLKHSGAQPVNFTLQCDASGTGAWVNFTNVTVPSHGYAWQLLPADFNAVWVRIVADRAATGVTAYFHLANPPVAPAPELFAGLADAAQSAAVSEGIIRPRSGNARTLQFAATLVGADGVPTNAYYEIDEALQLHCATNTGAEEMLRTRFSLTDSDFSVDSASVIYTEGTDRFRLPKNNHAFDTAFASGWPRGKREVVTERALFNAHGTFYELPYEGSGGFRHVRPVATHNKRITDFASWRGMLALAGVAAGMPADGHIFRSTDGQAALWFGDVDDLWRMGAPAGVGGPWNNTTVVADVPSDPYLMLGYERKELELSHTAAQSVTFIIEVDFTADNAWCEYTRIIVPPGQTVKHLFPAGYNAHWVRLKSDAATTATATFTYGSAGSSK
ncbi:MAG: hypothetical protein NTZ16_13025 [Verrucomicrobia bacterium]|nr:hypothetical protein [Verrucomicrobiota bacterium]